VPLCVPVNPPPHSLLCCLESLRVSPQLCVAGCQVAVQLVGLRVDCWGASLECLLVVLHCLRVTSLLEGCGGVVGCEGGAGREKEELHMISHGVCDVWECVQVGTSVAIDSHGTTVVCRFFAFMQDVQGHTQTCIQDEAHVALLDVQSDTSTSSSPCRPCPLYS
jgi:hypothetical protein